MTIADADDDDIGDGNDDSKKYLTNLYWHIHVLGCGVPAYKDLDPCFSIHWQKISWGSRLVAIYNRSNCTANQDLIVKKKEKTKTMHADLQQDYRWRGNQWIAITVIPETSDHTTRRHKILRIFEADDHFAYNVVCYLAI